MYGRLVCGARLVLPGTTQIPLPQMPLEHLGIEGLAGDLLDQFVGRHPRAWMFSLSHPISGWKSPVRMPGVMAGSACVAVSKNCAAVRAPKV